MDTITSFRPVSFSRLPWASPLGRPEQPSESFVSSDGVSPLGKGLRFDVATQDVKAEPFLGAPMREYLQKSALAAVPHTMLTPAGSAALSLAAQVLTPPELVASNPGYYHSPEHPLNVAGAVGEVAQSFGRTPQRAKFLQQVALLHDFDERQGSKPGAPARAQVTLHWMDQNQGSLQTRFGWSSDEFKQAKALIARTDFPLDDKPRSYGTPYDGKSPIQVYKETLEALPADQRAQVMEDGRMLSYSDQVGNYIGSVDASEASVRGLALEIGMDGDKLLAGSAGFQKGIGADIDVDHRVAAELGVPARFASKDELDAALSPDSRANLLQTRAYFEAIAGGRV